MLMSISGTLIPVPRTISFKTAAVLQRLQLQGSTEHRSLVAGLLYSNMSRKKGAAVDVENIPRTSFTPGWSKSISEVDALPVKRNGKVVRVTRTEEDVEEESAEEEEEAQPEKKSKKRSKDVAKEELTEEEKAERQRAIKKARAERAIEVPMVVVKKTPYEVRQLQQRVAEICNAIVADPEKSLKKKASSTNSEGEPVPQSDPEAIIKYRMVDLFDLLKSNDAQVFEMAMLSGLLVFKDICPSYRIRSVEEYDKDVQLKKETKSLKDFELSLLGAYQKFLKMLETKVEKGLGSAKKEVAEWGVDAKLGLSALRCQCELLRSLSHFNFRTQILATVTMRATQPNEDVSNLCCETLKTLLTNDHQAELSYEIVKDIAKVLMLCKYNTTEHIVRCLTHVKLTVHADDAKSVHRKAKSERKKRKQNQDEVELGLLESSATADVGNKKRFQSDCLHEICLIYFRIVKGKVGFSLLPAALDGLSRITHLINIDTVQDLMSLLKGILEQTIPAPVVVQLQCVHCALRTLSGPGAELNLDGDIYLHKLRTLIRDLPAGFDRWDNVLECMDLCFLKKREERANIVLSFTRLLLMSAVHLSNTNGTTVYAMAHTILLRYPRVRQDMLMLRSPMLMKIQGTAATTTTADVTVPGRKAAPVLFTEDEVVEDLAMKSLREESVGESNMDHVNWDFKEDKLGDGSWVLPLQRAHVDPRYENIAFTLSHQDLLPMPLRISDAQLDAGEFISQRLAYALQVLPTHMPTKSTGSKNAGAVATTGISAAKAREQDRKRGFAPKKSAFKGKQESSGAKVSNNAKFSQGKPNGGAFKSKQRK